MNSQTTRRGLISAIGLGWCFTILSASTGMAQSQQRYYPQPQGYPQPQSGYPQQYAQPPGYGYPQQLPPTQYESPLKFLPKFGQRMSEMARRLFYGKDPTGYDYPSQGYGQSGGYNLDSTPRQQSIPNYPQQSPQGYPIPGSGYAPQQPGYQYPQQQPQGQQRYNYPPQQQPTTTPAPTHSQQSKATQSKTTPAPQSKPSSSSSTRKYTPPRVSESPPPTKTTSKPATVTPKKEPKPDAPPPTPQPTTRRSESTPKEFPTTTSSGASGSFLKGKKTAKPGRVISPYPPYKELDITGLESGSLALDPTTQKVFEVP